MINSEKYWLIVTIYIYVYMGVSIVNGGTPIAGWFISGKLPVKWMIWAPLLGNPHIGWFLRDSVMKGDLEARNIRNAVEVISTTP